MSGSGLLSVSLKQDPDDKTVPSPHSVADIEEAAVDADIWEGDFKLEDLGNVTWPACTASQ
jgi:hypothetical protein